MTGHKFIGSLAGTVAAMLAAGVLAQAATPLPEPSIPVLSEAHRGFLAQLTRRTLREAVLGRDKYEPPYVPEALRSQSAEMIVRLREGGYLLAAGVGGPAPVAEATRNAALAAAEEWLRRGGDRLDQLRLLGELLVEIEAAGPAQALNIDVDWTSPGAVDPYLEPGVHGVMLERGRLRHSVCPTEFYTSDMALYDALTTLAQKLASDPSQIGHIRLSRFRTVHWYQTPGAEGVVSLHRGLQVLPPQRVTRDALDAAVRELARYMVYRQQTNGHFSYQYEPALDVYSESDNPVRQAGATLALCVYARHGGEAAVRPAADKALQYHLARLTDFAAAADSAYIATPDGNHKLGVTALIALALAEHPEDARQSATRDRLVRAMLKLQQPSGMFLTAFSPDVQIDAQDYFPGEALLALARAYERNPSADILTAFDRALDFYREYFEQQPSPAFVPWQVQAFATMARQTKRQDYAEYVFRLTDWLAGQQLSQASCPWPELWGGVASSQVGRAGVATASYLEGFTDALALAQFVGDGERVRRYQELVRAAARFVLQLQVRAEEAYYIRSPQDAVGGIRTNPALNLLRIDHCQHALLGLLKTRQVLYP